MSGVKRRVIDLTQTIFPEMATHRLHPKPVLIHYVQGYSYPTRGGKGSADEIIIMSSHTGTHLDAPLHEVKDGREVLDYPVSTMYSEAVLLHIPKNREEFITVEDVKRAEEESGGIIEGDIVFIYMEWDEKADRDQQSDEYHYHNPGLSAEAAEYLTSKKVTLVGLDSPNIDCSVASREAHAKGSGSPAHLVLLSNGVLIIEGLTNLGALSKKRFTAACLPLKMRKLSGACVRVIAIEE